MNIIGGTIAFLGAMLVANGALAAFAEISPAPSTQPTQPTPPAVTAGAVLTPPGRAVGMDCENPKAAGFLGAGDAARGFVQEDRLRGILRAGEENVTFQQVEPPVTCLQRFFSNRARRQQKFMDGGALITAIGVTGAFASGGAGVATQTYWGTAGFAPILVSNFNAYEPTRELYEIGGRGIDLVRARYVGMNTTSKTAEDQWKRANNADEGNKTKESCEKLWEHARTLADKADKEAGPYREALEPELERLAKACQATNVTREHLKQLMIELPAKPLAYAYATDILTLREELKDRDRSVRYTPLQTLSGMLAAPFLAVGATLAGSNGAASATTMSEAAALKAFTMPLWSSGLSAPPSLIDESQQISPVTKAVINSALRSTDKKVAEEAKSLELGAILDELIKTQDNLSLAASRLNAVSGALARFKAFDVLDMLRASTDPVSRQGQVLLQPASAAAIPAQVNGGTPGANPP